MRARDHAVVLLIKALAGLPAFVRAPTKAEEDVAVAAIGDGLRAVLREEQERFLWHCENCLERPGDTMVIERGMEGDRNATLKQAIKVIRAAIARGAT